MLEANIIWLIFWFMISVLFIVDIYISITTSITIKTSLIITLVFIVFAMIFGGIISLVDQKAGIEFFTGYFIEKSLSLDNIFVIKVIFDHFNIPKEKQHKVLMIGVISALVLRAIMIWGGIILITKFNWVMQIFAVILLFSGLKMLFSKKDVKKEVESGFFLKLLDRKELLANNLNHFFVRNNGRIKATKLLGALLAIEFADVVFAIDSIPAIFAITNNQMIVYSSNIFAILGLRALYNVLADLGSKFHYLNYALAFILCYIGFKILLMNFVHIPIIVSLIVIFFSIFIAVVVSIFSKTSISK